MGEVETLKEAGSKAIGLRVFLGQRAASTYSSDFSRAGLEQLVSSALTLAKITSEDPHAGLPEKSQLGSFPATSIFSTKTSTRFPLPSASSTPAAPKGRAQTPTRASRTPKAALSTPRPAHKVLANSLGFVGEYSRSYCSVSAVPIALRMATSPRCSATTGTPPRVR